ncbi:MAG TPA: response regulator transcription factor [Thiotrichales bacterium]|nr:MAG: hypothetical protein B7Y29_07310 [Thiotrichales bacterium 16-46-22]HQT03159.1 response regulator transcription factor [Thiotrichales bacterium]HQT05486.1 response regulator transcription factor [Thiotrichales bacterium]
MKHLFISQQTEAFPQWLEAFPTATLVSDIESQQRDSAGFIWLLDNFPNAHSLIGAIKARTLPVVVMSLTPSVSDSIRFFEAGASGYCHALANPSMLHHVVESVQAGGIWIGAELMQQMVHLIAQRDAQSPRNQANLALFTPKEKQVAELVAQGLTNKEVAKALAITDRTVKAHLASAFDKLNVRDRIQLTLFIRG